MASQDEVRQIALSPCRPRPRIPGGFRFFVDGKAFVWVWLERVDPKRARVPNGEVIAVRVGNEFEKESLLDVDPSVFFTEPHYDGYPAVLVRLPAIDLDLLRIVVTDAWRCRASRRLLAAFEGGTTP